ncbi:hypothetical protein QBC47DRAFT_384862 [Echria macrotheca]|uniref:AGC-kinase C-terminal domain-containing protein n=1 Tax=Echria macrotheca TaxID=438768 RepID=A0AAJ0BCW8_9PEZI|nr:hypothetical protein QBC47DRAFT_384862 [Echria macrotheca]
MLSHLRFHRRAPSNPTSPLPEAPPAWETTAQDHLQNSDDASPRLDARPQSANSTNTPPTLPPITRVTSDTDLSFESARDDGRPASQDSRIPPSRQAYDGGRSGFLGGMALHNYRRAAQGEQRPESAGESYSSNPLPDNLLSRAKPPPPPINTGFFRPVITKQSKTQTSFVAPTELQGSGGGGGKRPAGGRIASEPAPAAVTATAETQKGKKGLPFLKNPMSTLLMRRKTGQSAAVVQPLPFREEPSYDPRIRGTRVHDFSAPRPRRVDNDGPISPLPIPDQVGDAPKPSRMGEVEERPGPYHRVKSDALPPLPEDKDSPDQPVPPVPPKDGSAGSHRTSSSLTSRAPSVAASGLLGSSSSVRTTASRNMSLSRSSMRDSSLSAIPKHMKSTSSRFSFDMIGAANQEKLLEERHRQREQEKKTTDPDTNASRDSRFDDFDGDDFDYDAMMDDDGLEEPIPGVNADYDEEEEFPGAMDPDNDQDNFAGFVFQRSNPVSSLASPHTPAMLATPRDAEGKAIGFALTKDTTPDMPPTASPLFFQDLSLSSKLIETDSGLGIHPISTAIAPTAGKPIQEKEQAPVVALPPPRNRADDDLYFDEGLADELDFDHEGPAFDESIFDVEDTDKFGRPIPGAFAQAQEAMRVAQQQASKRNSSDITSRSEVSGSTAHTSLSAGFRLGATNGEKGPEDDVSSRQLPTDAMQSLSISGQDMAYQAALAEAAHKAAASGKFRRSSSPPVPAELTITSPTDSSTSRRYSEIDASLDDYEEDPLANNMDDFDFDDDAIIAEANASALANDSDGFYGQEFGFYSAPLSQPHHGHHSASSSNGSTVLSAENLFQYANGGYFGPAGQGLGRTTSGRVVSREPNLTPITERSEYSNRNSIMSLALPPPIGSDGRSSAAGMQSPGLAQLAMLSSDDDNMTLSALMKLRSRAWGGSQASLASSREGSPRSERAPLPGGDPSSSPWNPGVGYLGPAGHGHVRKNSSFSLWSSSDAGESGAGSPTLMVAPLTLPLSPPVPVPALFSPPVPGTVPPSGTTHGGTTCSPVLEGEEGDYEAEAIDGSLSNWPGDYPSSPPAEPTSPTTALSSLPQRRPGMGHRHKGSADSISYTKEEEPESGGTRWVLERRRTAESGEIEILGREVVEGGRI